MQKFWKTIESIGMKMALNLIKSKKDQIIKHLNSKLDIPFIGEKEEKALLENCYEMLEEVAQDLVDGKIK